MLGYRLARRTPYSAEVTRAIDTPYQVVRGQDEREYLLNHFKVHLGNLGWDSLKTVVSLAPEDLQEGVELILPPGGRGTAKTLESGEGREFDLFLKIPKARFMDPAKEKSIPLLIEWGPGLLTRATMKLIGPSSDL